MVRLIVPLAAVAIFFACSWTTVRFFHPREPRRFFLLYALLLLVATTVVILRYWPIVSEEDALGLLAALLLQLLACLTMWNAFYSLLWGFSGSLMNSSPPVRCTQRNCGQRVKNCSTSAGVISFTLFFSQMLHIWHRKLQ